MSQFLENVQYRLKTSSVEIFNVLLKIFSGGVLGLTFAIAGQEIVGYGRFSFIFIIVVCALAFLRVAKGWRIGAVLIFNLVMILLGMLLRMYVQLAPGA